MPLKIEKMLDRLNATILDIKNYTAKHEQTKIKERVSPEKAQKQLSKLLTEFVNKKHELLIIQAEAGLGKSTAVIDSVLRKGEVTLVFVPTHKLGKELFEKAQKERPELTGLVMAGKERIGCNLAVQEGIPTSKVKCTSCEELESCKFTDQFKRMSKADYVILAHDYLIYGISKGIQEELGVFIKPTQIVIDESFWQKMVQVDIPVALDDLELAKAKLKYFYKDKRRDSRPHELFTTLISCLKTNGSLTESLEINGVNDPDIVKLAIKDFKSVCEPFNIESYFFGKSVYRLLLLLEKELQKDRSEIHQIKLDETNKAYKLFFMKDYAFKKINTLVIDANADEILTTKVLQYWGEQKFEKISVKRKGHITQIASKNFNTSGFFTKDKTASKEIEEINCYIREQRKTKKVLCICPKKIKHWIDSPHVEHFGAIRGLDQYKDFDLLVLVGRNQPPVEAVENNARALFGSAYRPIKFIASENEGRFWHHKQSYLMRNNKPSKQQALVHFHPDWRCNLILNQVRECESVQAISRLRDIWQGGKEIMIFSNIPLDLPVDKLMLWSDFTKKGSIMDQLLEAVDWQKEVFPITDAQYWCDHESNLFQNTDTFKNQLRKYSLLSDGRKLQETLLERKPSLQLYQYKNPQQKNWSKATSPFDLQRTRFLLNAMYNTTELQVKVSKPTISKRKSIAS